MASCFSLGFPLTGLHGVPEQIVQAGRSFVTTLPAPTEQPSPIVTPGRMIDPAPMWACLPMITSAKRTLRYFSPKTESPMNPSPL